MKEFEKALDDYFRCGSNMGKGKINIYSTLLESNIPKSCVDGIFVYLAVVQKNAPCIEAAVENSYQCLDKYRGCGKNPCGCANRLQLIELLTTN